MDFVYIFFFGKEKKKEKKKAPARFVKHKINLVWPHATVVATREEL